MMEKTFLCWCLLCTLFCTMGNLLAENDKFAVDPNYSIVVEDLSIHFVNNQTKQTSRTFDAIADSPYGQIPYAFKEEHATITNSYAYTPYDIDTTTTNEEIFSTYFSGSQVRIQPKGKLNYMMSDVTITNNNDFIMVRYVLSVGIRWGWGTWFCDENTRVLIFNRQGEKIQEFTFGFGCSAILTQNGKYMAIGYGDEQYPDQEPLLKGGFAIYNVKTGECIINKELQQLTSQDTYIYLNGISTTGKNNNNFKISCSFLDFQKYLICDFSSQKLYSANFSINTLSHLKEVTVEGFLFREGESIRLYRYDRDFEQEPFTCE